MVRRAWHIAPLRVLSSACGGSRGDLKVKVLYTPGNRTYGGARGPREQSRPLLDSAVAIKLFSKFNFKFTKHLLVYVY